jgi:nicotinate-nucleotide pyrophosphorylase (carboxylating)
VSGRRERLVLTGETGEVIERALREDAPEGDVTSEAIFAPDHRSEAVVVTRRPCVVAGLPVFAEVYRRVAGDVVCEPLVEEGDRAGPDCPVVRLRGPTSALLTGERTALNFLQRLSGIATRTRALVERLAGSGITILDTRKTTPGLRALEKYAVRVGGGRNHRLHLSEMILIKENHADAAGGIGIALERVMAAERGGRPVEVEVRDFDELAAVIPFRVDRVMLDNFTPEAVRRAIDLLDRSCGSGDRPAVEISGGVTEETIDAYRIEGVDYISVGALTHSVASIDMTMRIAGDAGDG